MSTMPRDRTKANPNARGTSNRNVRGSSYDVRRRKHYLLKTYAANWPLVKVTWAVTGETTVEPFVMTVDQLREYAGVADAEEVPTCRCYRCGKPLWFETLTVDRIVPGCKKTPAYPKGGTYVRANIRPACSKCNSETGAPLANGKAHQKGKVKR